MHYDINNTLLYNYPFVMQAYEWLSYLRLLYDNWICIVVCGYVKKICELHYARNDNRNIFLLQNITCIQFKINNGWNIFLLQQYITSMYIGFHILWETYGEEYIPYV